jgi:hypothetical protein
MAIICLWFYGKLRGSPNPGVKYWSLFFLFFCLNSLAGIVRHGFASYFSQEVNTRVWMFLNNLLNVPCAFALLKANLEVAYSPQERKKMLNLVIVASSVLFTALIIIINKFWVGMINSSLAMLITFIHYIVLNNRKRISGAGLVALGFGFSFLSVLVFAAKISLNDWFNHKDIAHVIIIIGLSIIYRGVKKSTEAPASGSHENTGTLERAVA